jgi:hypothetical protein
LRPSASPLIPTPAIPSPCFSPAGNGPAEASAHASVEDKESGGTTPGLCRTRVKELHRGPAFPRGHRGGGAAGPDRDGCVFVPETPFSSGRLDCIKQNFPLNRENGFGRPSGSAGRRAEMLPSEGTRGGAPASDRFSHNPRSPWRKTRRT